MSTSDKPSKRDRTARLLRVEHLLYQNPGGLKVEEIASQCEVSKRTAYRDLAALERELGVPIWEEGTRRGIVKGYLLPPIHFNLLEALNVFLAARLMLGYAHRYDPNVASTFMKLNSIVSPPLREQIVKTMEWMRKQPKDDRYLRTLATLAEAWISRKRVRIVYRALEADRPTERIIEPYFIEPAAAGHSSYVIGYCHHVHEVRTFKIQRIESIELTSDNYVVPPDFDANEFLGFAWGITVYGEVKTVKLRFDPEISRIIEETVWHPSQLLEREEDGSVIMTLRVALTEEVSAWILSWGAKVKVLVPEVLGQEIIEIAKAILGVCRGRQDS